MPSTSDSLISALAQFIGTDQWYRHPLNPAVTFTDGVKYFAEKAEAFWLLDILATELVAAVREHGIIFTTTTSKDGRATITARRDSDQPPFYTRDIEATDLPEGDWPLWIADGGPGNTVTILLPSEY